jgi:hypothetical protein
MYACTARFFAALTLVGAGFGFAEPALALEGSTLGDVLFGAPRAAAPAVSRYEVGNGSFVLDTAAGKQAYLKFEDSPEIWALRPTAGPRGDIIYKNDMGEPVVRATRLGGVTIFTPGEPDGMPAAFIGQGVAPRMMRDMEPEALFNIFVQASARVSRMAQHLVVFEGAQDITPASAPVYADAAILTSQAFTRVGNRGKEGRMLVARFVKVEFNAGKDAAASAKGQVVRITVCPDQGVAGRPSSERIASVISRK